MGSGEQLCLLGIFAHPDDEQGVGGVFTRAVREHGAKAWIVSATSGQAGQISDPALATPETLGAVREQELRDALTIYGWEPPILLGYQDGQLANLPDGVLRDDLVRIIRKLRPQVLVTFDPTGIYGHIDHIAVHLAAVAAFEKAADPAFRPELGAAHQTSKLYYVAVTRSLIRQISQSMDEDLDLGGDQRTIERSEVGVPDEMVTTVVDVRDLTPLRTAGLFAHKTQFSQEMRQRMERHRATSDAFGREMFIRVWPAPAPGATLPDETDILTGLSVAGQEIAGTPARA